MTGVDVGFDVVLFRVGKLEGFVGYGTLGSPTVATVEQLARAAVAKAEGKPVDLSTVGA